jgi:GDP-4-dehydro-6-deoxy-D-mannose reductase
MATIDANLASTYNLLEAVRRHAPEARVVVAGSSEMYGPVPHVITESEPPRPQNPYAVSKAAADALAGFFADAHGMQVIRARAFNHAGPGQSDRYVVGALARQIAAGEREIVTGDLRPRRDFTDVRDVVRAYVLLAERAEPGAYNVCSGETVAIADILAGLARHADVRVDQRTDPERVRAGEVMEIRGSHEKLTQATGWLPQIALDRTLADTLEALR